ncbi:MAG: class E sortase [Candidatus Gracilibacteria bacterium]
MIPSSPEIFDPLQSFTVSSPEANIGEEQKDTLSQAAHQPLKPQTKRSTLGFLGRYFTTSAALFVILMLITNFSAYSQMVGSILSPERLSQSQASLFSALESANISALTTVHAGYNIQSLGENDALIQRKADEIKDKLESRGVEIDPLRRINPAKFDTAPAPIKVDFDVTPYENRIIIPKIGKNIPLVDVNISHDVDFDHMENIFMQELENGVVRYPGTAAPGEDGNSFIFGHSSNYPWIKGDYNEIFALLDKLDPGDDIIVYYQQKKYVYKVTEKKVVRPGDVKALSERDPHKKELSLMTCWPVGTTYNRLLVFTELQ